MENFNRELTPGNTKAAMKDVGAASSDLWKVEPAKLRTLKGFNARIINDTYTSRVRWIADSIKANGFYPDKPLTGFVALEDGKEVIYVTGGHRRFEAVFLAIEEGADVPTVPVVIKPRGTSMEDLTVDLVVGNEGEPLTTYEQAAMVKSGTGRVTAKHMPDADFKKAVKKHAEPMYTALTKVQADPGFAKLSKEVRELLAELLQGLKKPVDDGK